MTLRSWLVGLAAGCVLLVSPAARAAESPQAYWTQVQSSIRQGAYQDALQTLERLHELTPDDPRVLLYRDLCQQRLQGVSKLKPASPDQVQALKHQLAEEARQRERAARERETLERAMKREQTRWDQQLQRLEREAAAERKRQRGRAQTEAVQAARVAREAARTHAIEGAVAPTGQPHAPPKLAQVTTPVGPGLAPVVREQSDRSVELAPVKVPTFLDKPAAAPVTAEAVSPSLIGRKAPPPGAVEMNAEQMHVVSERNLAIAEGSVEVVYGNAILTADRITLFTDTHDIYAEGHVRLERGTEVFRGEMVHYNFDTGNGRFLQGTVYTEPWYEHGRTVEHIAKGVY